MPSDKTDRPLDILLLSSMPLRHSAGLGGDMVRALERSGHRIDFLTAFPFEGMTGRMRAVCDKNDRRRMKRRDLCRKVVRKLSAFFRPARKGDDPGIVIVNAHEDNPPIDPDRVASAIDGRYDLVITLFWHGMITARTLQCVYRKTRCPILIYAVDMFPVTGGCFYFNGCDGYTRTCGRCPALGSGNPDDATHRNYMIKKSVYDSTPCAYLGNTWMMDHARRSGLFAPERLFRSLIVIDDRIFRERDAATARRRFGIGPEKRMVLFAGAQLIGEKRKGFDYLIRAIGHFMASLPEAEREGVVLLLAGRQRKSNPLREVFPVEVCEAGTLDTDALVDAYSAATAFLCPSIDDAGPSMVNQSLLCGTPVVAFATGVALDLVVSGETGYRAVYKDHVDFARGIRSICDLDPTAYRQLRDRARARALQLCSPDAFRRNIEAIHRTMCGDSDA